MHLSTIKAQFSVKKTKTKRYQFCGKIHLQSLTILEFVGFKLCDYDSQMSSWSIQIDLRWPCFMATGFSDNFILSFFPIFSSLLYFLFPPFDSHSPILKAYVNFVYLSFSTTVSKKDLFAIVVTIF